MAAKKASTRKYRQAKQAAKPAAKAAFPGKKQAAKRDPKLKISAEDRIVAKEVSDSAKADLGKNAYLKKSDYEATQKAAREKFRESMREEGLYPEKKTTASEAPKKPAVKKAAKKAAVKKAAVKPAKTMGEISKEVTGSNKPVAKKAAPKAAKSAANKAAWAKMSPEERRNWNANKPGATAPKVNPVAEAPVKMPKQSTANTPSNIKPSPEVKAAAKRPTDASLRAKEDAYLKQTKERLAAKPKPTAPKASAPKPAAPKPAAKAAAAVKKGSRTVRASKFIAKKFPLAMVAGEVISAGKGSTFKDLKEINRLKGKLGDKPMSAKEGAATQASNLANLASMGLVGKTRRQRMDELNAKIKKKEAATAKANKGLRYGPGGESLVPGTAAYKAGSKTRPSGNAAPKPTTGAGGSSTKYVVKKGDTLSGIAKNSGLSLSEVRNMNPELMKNPKYKKGSMIWSGTKVNIKKK
jgi:LysM repeat protein